MIVDTRVRSLMQTEVISVDVASPPSAVRRLLDTHRFHHVPVLDGDVLVGIVSTVDLARVSLERWVEDKATRDAWLDREWSLAALMTPLPDVLHPDDPIRVAAERLADGAYHALPVVDADRRLVGIVTSTDLLRFLVPHLR